VITGAHSIIYTERAEEVRAFFRDVLDFSCVDAGGGWLIFGLPVAELAAHPAEDARHELYLMCDDIETTVDDLKKKGVMFTRPITDTGWGRVTALALPDGRDLAIYEPRHPTLP
jgi:predicted enzyme related to lactoylglutathione lyase